MVKRPKLADVCSVVDSLKQLGGRLYLKLTGPGQFEVYRLELSYEPDMILIDKPCGRREVRRAIDQAEKLLHDRRRETSQAVIEEE